MNDAPVAPFRHDDGRCWFNNGTTKTTCDAYPIATKPIRRLCICKAPRTSRRLLSAVTPFAPARLQAPLRRLLSAPSAASPSHRGPSSPLLVGTLLAGAVFADARRAPVVGVLAVAFMALSMPGAKADNWNLTPGRANGRASTVKPCTPRKSPDTEKHAQVGPGQTVVTKWASGHQRPSYWVVLAGSDEIKLRLPNFEAIVNEYLDKPPAGTDPSKINLNTDPKWKRYHGTQSKTQEAVANAALGEGMSYKREVPQTDPYYLTHPSRPSTTSKVYEYNDLKIPGDKRAQYNHTNYSWILAAGRYDHPENLPSDYDVLQWEIPRPLAKGPGHYIIHWRWQGYYECVDVDAFDDQVANVYGKKVVDNNGRQAWTFQRIEHCQFVQTGVPGVYPDAHPTYVVGKCLKAEVPTSLANTGIENSAWPCKYAINSDAGLVGQEKRIGINVVPAKLPSLVKFRTPNTPYADPACANSPLLVLSGKVSEKMVDFAAYFASRGEKKVAGRCNAANYVWERNATLKQAMSDCTATECVGISWYDAQPLEFSNSAATQGPRDFRSGEPISSAGAVYLFRGCNGSVDDTTTAGWSSLLKNPAATAPTSAPTSIPTSTPSVKQPSVVIAGVDVSWTFEGSKVKITATAPGKCWIAVGVSTNATMIGGRVVIGANVTSTSAKVLERILTAKNIAGIGSDLTGLAAGATIDAGATLVWENNKTILTFTTSGSIAGQALNLDGTDNVIVAVGAEGATFGQSSTAKHRDKAVAAIVWGKPYPAPTANAGKVFKVGVSFQPETLNSSITLPSGWVADTGSTYASRGNGYNYGWTCTMPTLHPKFAPPMPIAKNSHSVTFSGTMSGMALAVNMYPETRLDNLTIAPSANTTFARNLHMPCANGDRRLWEMEVPSGVYKVPPREHARSHGRTTCTPAHMYRC